MVDGLGDKMESSEAADKHKPLNHMLDDMKKGSEKLESAKVNVWGQPLSGTRPPPSYSRVLLLRRRRRRGRLRAVAG